MGLKYPSEYILAESKLAHDKAEADQADLEILGVTDAWLSQYQQEIDTAEAMPDHRGRQTQQVELTQDKDEDLEACYHWGLSLQERIRFLHGTGSPLHKRFPTAALHDAHNSERKMMPLMETLIEIAIELEGGLTEDGEPPELAADGIELLAALRASDHDQETKRVDNLAATQERTEAFQNLYDKVNRINRAGRVVFKGNPAKLARYRSPWYKYRTQRRRDEEPPADGDGEDTGEEG